MTEKHRASKIWIRARKSVQRRYISLFERLNYFHLLLLTCFIVISCFTISLPLKIQIKRQIISRSLITADDVIDNWLLISDDDVELLTNLSDGDPSLISFIRENMILPPPLHKLTELNETYNQDPSKGQAKRIANLFENDTKGFFIECGAMDGYFYSNTLYLEKALGWTGLLIEPDPDNFAKLMTFKRDTWLAPTCLSIKAKPVQVSIRRHMGGYAKTVQMPYNVTNEMSVDVLCIPIGSLLQALDAKHVDFFSLDIEGLELDVLRTFPFDTVDVTAFAVEFSHITEGKIALTEFMAQKGYQILQSTEQEMQNGRWAEEDIIFVKKDWKPLRK